MPKTNRKSVQLVGQLLGSGYLTIKGEGGMCTKRVLEIFLYSQSILGYELLCHSYIKVIIINNMYERSRYDLLRLKSENLVCIRPLKRFGLKPTYTSRARAYMVMGNLDRLC